VDRKNILFIRLRHFIPTLGLIAANLSAPVAAAEAVPEIRVTARRLPPSVNEPAYATTTLDRDALARAPGARLDDALRAVPGFGLFRRQSSRAAHPTTQGVSLRGLGPSGAGRTLVLLDGIPQNDAFGGWIDWSRLPAAALDTAAVTRGGGAGPWGNAALAGVIRLSGRELARSGGALELSAGTRDSFDGTALVQGLGERGAWHGLVHGHRTDGAILVRADQRGPVDRRAADRGGVAEAGGRLAVGERTVVRAVARYSDSRFVNGLDIAVSKARVADGALSLLYEADDTALEANVYGRDQGFRAVFAAVNAARTAATPSLDQFSVPARAAGGNVVVRRRLDAALWLDAGADVRVAEGETNENFQNLGQGFTRLRRAGGEQRLAGVFAEANWRPTPALLATLGGRLDAWRQSDGLRRESVLATGALVRDERFPDRDGTVGTVRGGVRYDADARWTLRAAAYTGFRLPTLNELYRPFRVGNDITEANPALDLERLAGGEAGFDWRPMSALALGATYFHAVLTDAVTNVTVRTAPGLDPGLNVVVPPGGVLRQRRNLSRIVTDGVEADLTADLDARWRLTLRYLYSAPTVARSPQQPALRGLRLAQVPRHQATAELTWRSAEGAAVSALVRGAGPQFDDDQNTRRLAGYAVADLSAEVRLGEGLALTAAVENLFDRTVEAGRSADGLVSVGTPRSARLGLRVGF